MFYNFQVKTVKQPYGGGGGVAMVTGENGEILHFENPFHHKNRSPFFTNFRHSPRKLPNSHSQKLFLSIFEKWQNSISGVQTS